MTTAANILVGAGGSIYVGPVGATLPTDLTSPLDGSFTDVGYISEDGITLSASTDVTDIGAFQSLLPVRKIVTGRNFDLSFTLREWQEQTLVLAFGGGEVSETTSGVYRYDPPAAGDALYERAMVVEWRDGDKNYRLVINRGTVSEAVETSITRTNAADLPITFSVLDDDGDTYFLLTDDPAMEPSGS
jgi:hypothetical protein